MTNLFEAYFKVKFSIVTFKLPHLKVHLTDLLIDAAPRVRVVSQGHQARKET